MRTDPVVGRTSRGRRAGRAALAVGAGVGVVAAITLAWLGGRPTSPNDLTGQGNFVAPTTTIAAASSTALQGFTWERAGIIPARRLLAITERQGALFVHAVPPNGRGLELFESHDGRSWELVERVIGTQYIVSALAAGPDGNYLAAVHTQSFGEGTHCDLAVAHSEDGVGWSEPVQLGAPGMWSQIRVALGNDIAVVSANAGSHEGHAPPEAVAALPTEWQQALAEWPQLTAIDQLDALVVVGPLGLSLARFSYEDIGFEPERRAGPGVAVTWLSTQQGKWIRVELGDRTSIGSGPVVHHGEVLAQIYRRGAEVVSITEAGPVTTDIHGGFAGQLVSWGERLVAVDQSYPSVREWSPEGWTAMGAGRMLPLRSDYLVTGARAGPAGLAVTIARQPRVSPEIQVEATDGFTLVVLPWDRVRVLDPDGETILESPAQVWNSARLSFDVADGTVRVLDESGKAPTTQFRLADMAAANDEMPRALPRYTLFSDDGSRWVSSELDDGAPIVPLLVSDQSVYAAEQTPDLPLRLSPWEDPASPTSIQTWIGRFATGGPK